MGCACRFKEKAKKRVQALLKDPNQVAKNFTLDEVRCNCGCGQAFVNDELISFLQMIRDELEKPVSIHCINRCPAHNLDSGGSERSQHLQGKAADFHVNGMSIKELHTYMEGFYPRVIRGLGLYPWGVHADTGDRLWHS
ncbi:MAG: DUF882 domain-containing protein [bacterium]|nr:DUF882 domain-containing protein [bacterium]